MTLFPNLRTPTSARQYSRKSRYVRKESKEVSCIQELCWVFNFVYILRHSAGYKVYSSKRQSDDPYMENGGLTLSAHFSNIESPLRINIVFAVFKMAVYVRMDLYATFRPVYFLMYCNIYSLVEYLSLTCNFWILFASILNREMRFWVNQVRGPQYCKYQIRLELETSIDIKTWIMKSWQLLSLVLQFLLDKCSAFDTRKFWTFLWLFVVNRGVLLI